MNQLQAVALNEGLRGQKRLWRRGRQQLESFPLAPWASRRRRDLLELLDRLNPTIAELSQAIEHEAKNCSEAKRLMTHPEVGPLTALAFVLIIGDAGRLQCGKQVASNLGLVPLEKSSGNRRRLGHITKRKFDVAFSASGSGSGYGTELAGVAQSVLPSGHAPRTEDSEGGDSPSPRDTFVLDVAGATGL
jgi:Transposase IS116/IS110/IS902 family